MGVLRAAALASLPFSFSFGGVSRVVWLVRFRFLLSAFPFRAPSVGVGRQLVSRLFPRLCAVVLVPRSPCRGVRLSLAPLARCAFGRLGAVSSVLLVPCRFCLVGVVLAVGSSRRWRPPCRAARRRCSCAGGSLVGCRALVLGVRRSAGLARR